MGEKDSKCSEEDPEISIHRITKWNCRFWESMVQRRYELIFSCVANMNFIDRVQFFFHCETRNKEESEARNRRVHRSLSSKIIKNQHQLTSS